MSLIVIRTNFVVVSSVGIKRIVCINIKSTGELEISIAAFYIYHT